MKVRGKRKLDYHSYWYCLIEKRGSLDDYQLTSFVLPYRKEEEEKEEVNIG